MMRAARGFTLIEIMVAIFVIALLGGITVFVMGGFQKEPPLENAMKQLVTRLRMARMEAVFEQEDLGLAIDDRGYRFYRRADENSPWQVIADESVFESDVLPKHQALQLWVDGQAIQLSQTTPQVVLSPNIAKKFAIEMIGPDQKTFMIESDDKGDIAWAIH